MCVIACFAANASTKCTKHAKKLHMHASSVLSVLQHVAVLAASAVAQYTQARCSTLKMRLACVLLLATHMHAHMRACTRTAQKSMQCKQCFCIASMHIFCLRCCVCVLLCACKQQQAVRKRRAMSFLLHYCNKTSSTCYAVCKMLFLHS